MNHHLSSCDDQLNQHTNNPNPVPKHNKKRLTEEQVSLLESSFNINKKLEPERKLQLSRDLGIPPRQIAIWYQNKRARWKNQSLELDFSTLQLRLETTLAERKQLQREVERLRVELHQAQAQLAQAQVVQAQYPNVSSLSSCYDEAGSSSNFNGDHQLPSNWDMNDDQVLRVEEMYACLMGAANGSSSYV